MPHARKLRPGAALALPPPRCGGHNGAGNAELCAGERAPVRGRSQGGQRETSRCRSRRARHAAPTGPWRGGRVRSSPGSSWWPERRPCSTRRRRSSGAHLPAQTLSCNDNWVGGGASGDWDSAANWSTGVPNGADVSACITGNANVTLTDVSSSIGALTVSAGSSLTIGAGHQFGDTEPEHLVRPAEQRVADCWRRRDVRPPRSLAERADHQLGHHHRGRHRGHRRRRRRRRQSPPRCRTTAPSASRPAAWSTETRPRRSRTTRTGVLAFGIDGPPGSPTAYGRITGSTLALGGTADPVDEDGFTPPAGAEYFVGDGPSTGTFATVSGGATADYSHADELGLIGGLPPPPPSTQRHELCSGGLALRAARRVDGGGHPDVRRRPDRVGLLLRR